MKHPTSRLLHAYWDRLRGERAAPERGEIEPGEIRTLLADSLILEIEPERRHAGVRLAGTRLCALFGRELRGTGFAELWGDPVPRAGDTAGRLLHGLLRHTDRAPAERLPWSLVETVTQDTVGLVAGLRGVNGGGESLDLELVLLPLRYHGRTQARVLGALAPHCVPAWLGLSPVRRLEATSVRVLAAPTARADADGQPCPLPGAMRPPANDPVPVRRGHLLVHEGGRI